MFSFGVACHMVMDGYGNVLIMLFMTKVVCTQLGLPTAVSKGVSIVIAICDWASPPVCTSCVFLSQEDGVSISCLISIMGKGYFTVSFFMYMCGGLSMVAGILLSLVPCVSSTVLDILFVISGQLMPRYRSVRISFSRVTCSL